MGLNCELPESTDQGRCGLWGMHAGPLSTHANFLQFFFSFLLLQDVGCPSHLLRRVPVERLPGSIWVLGKQVCSPLSDC